jgi:hypothetical protein
LYQAIDIPQSTVAAGLPGVANLTDSTYFSASEAMKVDFIYADCEGANPDDIVIRPYLHEREFWVPRPVMPSNLNNYLRAVDSDEYGEWWLQEPFLAVRGHAIGIEIENRLNQLGCALKVTFLGKGRESRRPYHLEFDCNMPVGNYPNGVRQVFGGRNSYVSGHEDVWIEAVTWAKKIGNPDYVDPQGWNPRLIGMKIKPGYGTAWSGPGGGGAGGAYIPLIVYSNIRGPRAACFYRPPTSPKEKDPMKQQLILEQNDVINVEIHPYTPNNDSIAQIAVVGTSIAE